VKQALKEFKVAEKLRPIKIVTYFPTSQPEPLLILQNLSAQYRIPIITPASVFSEQELALLNKEQKVLDEQTKALFRKLKSRLCQNDCSNRGYILVNCPLFIYDAEIVFFNQKGKLKETVLKEQVEGEEGEAVEQEQQQEEDGEEGEKKEDWYPESVVILKDMSQRKQFQLSAFEFYKKRNIDVFSYDPHGLTDYEIQESLRVYVERVPLKIAERPPVQLHQERDPAEGGVRGVLREGARADPADQEGAAGEAAAAAA